MRILIVDDEEHLRRMMRLTLEATGYDVVDAADGEEGLKLFGDGRQFDATLLDQRMPGMDGLETLRRMKLQHADACIIMVTAYASIELAVDAMKLGATDFVRKPMTPDTLRHAVDAALAKRDSRPASPIPGAQQPAPTRPTSAQQPLPPVEIWTTNGFFIRRVARESPTNGLAATEHHFLVRRGKEGLRDEVVVSIDPHALARVAREAKRNLSPAGAFWRRQAESALVNYLWSEAALPEARRLVVSGVTASMLDAASSWSED
jgi:DNA-binding response OmpR family regulator